MFKVFKNVKKSTVSKNQLLIMDYKKQIDERDRRIHEFDQTDSILKKLKASYVKHKQDLPTKRYEALKQIIEEAIKELRHLSAVEHKSNTSRGKIGNLLKSAEVFASNAPLEGVETLCSGDVNIVDIDNKLKDLTREIENIKTGYRQRRDILEIMNTKYKEALLLDPIKRYAQVKMAAKSSIAAYDKII